MSTRDQGTDELRPIQIELNALESHPASVIYASGATKVLCTATLLGEVPAFLEGSGKGWASAEYQMLPAATTPRHPRERGKVSGRTQEIQRLIGRSIRGILDLTALDGYTLQIDCDVLQADGGTRTAAISGAYVALELAVRDAARKKLLSRSPITGAVAAVSAGIVGGEPYLDLNYAEDSTADVDLNLVATASGSIVEIQGTSEGAPLERPALDHLLDLAMRGIEKILAEQRRVLSGGSAGP